jgi:hypothetical protein
MNSQLPRGVAKEKQTGAQFTKKCRNQAFCWGVLPPINRNQQEISCSCGKPVLRDGFSANS